MEQAAAEPLRLTTRVRELPGVGPRRAEVLGRLGLHTVSDLIRHVPMRYEREAAEGTINDLPMDGIGTARGTVTATRFIHGIHGGRQRFQATLEDHAARLSINWFNAAYLRNKLHPGMVIRVMGKVKVYNGYPQMVNPTWEPLPEAEVVPAKGDRLRPIYSATEDFPSSRLATLIGDTLPAVLPQLNDPLPADFVSARRMPPLAEAFKLVHQPASPEEALHARRRLAFNELLLLQLGITLKRFHTLHHLAAPPLKWSPAIDEHLRARFPFQLTDEQDRVVREIAEDLRQSKPMNRLLQGDVGSGKTVVALYALLLAVANNRQGAIMVPTELLAEQHYGSIGRMLEGSSVRLALVTSGTGGAVRAELLRRIEAREIDIAIGTQALLTESVRFNDLAVVVVDEQHRFGVAQRAAFRDRAAPRDEPGGAAVPAGRQRSPHYLVMTATPIPRTLSLTVFGDLDASTIRGLPPGRSPIVTRVVEPAKADDVYRYLAKRVGGGEQAYVVLPTIDPSAEDSAAQLKSVRTQAKLLEDKYLKGFRVAMVHGQLKRETREAVMDRFRRGQIHVLVATTVIEVGVDVPNATVMIVEHAERFGLAQLHQLRGRVGRGTHGRKSLCVFIARPTTEEAARRMKAIGSTGDGFKIAEHDLEIRGMGDFFGTRQHGAPPLRVARIPGDMDLLEMARRDAQGIVSADPTLADPKWLMLRRVLIQQYGDALGLIDVG